MAKPFGMTKRGKICRYLREHPGEPFATKEIAAKFKTSVRNVQSLMTDLEDYGWTVTRHRGPERSVQIVTWPPVKAAK